MYITLPFSFYLQYTKALGADYKLVFRLEKQGLGRREEDKQKKN